MTRYICRHCSHEWDSSGTREVMRCSHCHRRQGIRYESRQESDVTTAGSKYICLHCFHEWDSSGTREVMRCSDCHRSQGIRYEKFHQAVEAAKAAFKKVADSPPPHRPPIEVVSDIPDALGPVLEVARKEFPNPLIPITLLTEIIRRATTELKENQGRKGR